MNSAMQLVTVNKIIDLKDAGFVLSDIAKILYSQPSIDSIISMLEDKAETKRTIPCMILFYNSTWNWKT